MELREKKALYDEVVEEQPVTEKQWDNIDKKGLTQTLKKMRQEYLPRLEMIKDTFIIGDIESFANEIVEMSEKNHAEPLSIWAKSLLQQTANFDMEKIPSTLNTLPSLIEKMEDILT